MDSKSQESNDSELIATIEEYMGNDENSGVDIRIFEILDNVEASESQLASIEKMIDVKIALRLRNMADSAYFGQMRQRKVNTFFDVVTSLGTNPVKLFIVAMALHTKLGEKNYLFEIESIATSLFARIIAQQMGFNDAARERAEIGGLFLNIGKIAVAIYEHAHKVKIEPSFIEKYHRKLASTIIEKFALPEYLNDIVQEDMLVLHKNSFSVQGIVFLAHALVEKLIDEQGLKIKSQVPDMDDNLRVTLSSYISDYFNLIGMGKYLKIIPIDEK